ncbi:hypothetical protein ABT218_19950 [Streptomyces sp. NPDC001455]|uniref:hypothetical protein n=1 Tax=unclassified Streptomyces TaxID=2593676 RepID=UPI00332EA991
MARTAQHLAVRAITAHGLTHPVTLALLAVAATAAARAWDAGHQVSDTHPSHPASSSPKGRGSGWPDPRPMPRDAR